MRGIFSCPNRVKKKCVDELNFPATVHRLGGSGHWGVVPASQHQEIPVALASLIRAERCGMALDIIVEELQR